MSDFSLWSVAIVFTKLSLYITIALTLGGVSMLIQNQNIPKIWKLARYYALFGSGLGVLIAVINFFLQVGQFAENGLLGMFDLSIITILWSSLVGSALQIHLFAWSIISIVLFFAKKHTYWTFIILLLLAMILPASFTLIGHTVEQNIWVRIALYLHISVGLWWMGSLFPLWRSLQLAKIDSVQGLMQQFGIIASVLVPLLLLTGVIIAYQLTGTIDNLLNSSHGQLFLLKVILVGVLLGIATLHKLYLVPRLKSVKKMQSLLRHSIAIEMVFGLFVLITTSILSTALGPANMT